MMMMMKTTASSKDRQVLEDRRTRARDAQNKLMSIHDFLSDHKIKANEHSAISCPFHGNDEDPSLGVTRDGHGFNCFGCGRKGGYIKFRMYWEQIVNGRPVSYNDIIEEILHERVDLCSELGFTTIFSSIIADVTVELDESGNLVLPSLERHKPSKIDTLTIKRIFQDLKTPGDIRAFIELVQKGNSEKYIMNLYSQPGVQSLLPEDFVAAELDALINGRLEESEENPIEEP